MKLKNILIVVKDIEKSRRYYHDLFGLELVVDNDGNMILTEGLVLQAESYWKQFLNKDVVWRNNSAELYFEEANLEEFIYKLESLYPETEFVNRLMEHSWGQKATRFYDLDGNLIEVGTPMVYEDEEKVEPVAYSLLVTYKFPNREKRDGFYEDVCDNKIAKIVMKEDGCVRYEYEIPEAETELLLHEVWEDKEAQQVHIQQPTMNFLKALKMKHQAETCIEEI